MNVEALVYCNSFLQYYYISEKTPHFHKKLLDYKFYGSNLLLIFKNFLLADNVRFENLFLSCFILSDR